MVSSGFRFRRAIRFHGLGFGFVKVGFPVGNQSLVWGFDVRTWDLGFPGLFVAPHLTFNVLSCFPCLGHSFKIANLRLPLCRECPSYIQVTPIQGASHGFLEA